MRLPFILPGISCLVFFISGCTFISKRKEFEGVITYQVSVTSKKPTPYLENLKKGLGDSIKIYFRKDTWRIEYIGKSDMQTVIYINRTGKQYGYGPQKDTLFIDDVTTAENELVDYIYTDETITITGKECKNFILEMSDKTISYYYSPDLYISPSRFNKHVFLYNNLYYENCKSPYLKSVSTGKLFIITYEAVKIEEKELPESLFSIPEGLPESSYKEKYAVK